MIFSTPSRRRVSVQPVDAEFFCARRVEFSRALSCYKSDDSGTHQSSVQVGAQTQGIALNNVTFGSSAREAYFPTERFQDYNRRQGQDLPSASSSVTLNTGTQLSGSTVNITDQGSVKAALDSLSGALTLANDSGQKLVAKLTDGSLIPQTSTTDKTGTFLAVGTALFALWIFNRKKT